MHARTIARYMPDNILHMQFNFQPYTYSLESGSGNLNCLTYLIPNAVILVHRHNHRTAATKIGPLNYDMPGVVKSTTK